MRHRFRGSELGEAFTLSTGGADGKFIRCPRPRVEDPVSSILVLAQ